MFSVQFISDYQKVVPWLSSAKHSLRAQRSSGDQLWRGCSLTSDPVIKYKDNITFKSYRNKKQVGCVKVRSNESYLRPPIPELKPG